MTEGGCVDDITLAIPASLVIRKSGFSIDFGGSFIKVAYATDEGDKVKLHFCSYPVDRMEQAFREIASRQIVAGEHQKVYTCGLGCNEHQAFIERTLGCRILNILEIDCFIDGFRFLTENFPLADVTYPQSESVIQYAEKMAERLATEHLLLSTKFKDTCRAKMWQSSKRIISEEQCSRDGYKNSYAGQTAGRVDQVQYPIILGLCGSATQVVKVEEDGSYTFVNLISASGKTIEALSSLITGVKSFEELVSLAETGCLHNVSTIGSKMNLDNDDVYGALSHGTLVFDLGRAVGKDAREFRREDLSLGIISLIIQMLVTSVHDWSLISDVTQVYFSGGLYQSPLIREMMGKYFEYKSNMNPLCGDKMTSVETDDERQQIEEDIQRIKSALEASSGDWQFSVEIEESEDDEEDALKIICHDWTSDGEHQGLPTTSLETTTADTGAYVKETQAEDGLSTDSDQLVQMGVALNRAYQDIVAENLEMVQLLLVQNQEKQKEIEKTISDDLAAKSCGDRKGKRRNPVNYGYPYFRNKDGLPPPLNYEAQCKKATEEPEPFLRPVKMWTKKEKEILQKAIQEDLIRQKLQPILNRRELDIEKLAQAKRDNDMDQVAMLSGKIDNLDKQIREIKNNPVEISDDVDSYIDTVDWMKISAIDFNGSRRDDECYVFWRNHLQPNINSSKWTPEEDRMLKELALEFDCCNWELIAQKLGTKRSAFQCLQRYQTKLNPCLQAGKWSTEEDNFLREVISSVRVGDTIPWDQVSYYMDCRSNEQCEQRWQQLQNTCKTGRWTEEEDKLLLDAVHRFGKEWIKVKDMVPNRTAQQCRERYVNTLSRDNKIGSWRYAEDRILWQCCQESTTLKWSQISAKIPGRSDNSCLQRYRLLLRLKQVEDILLKTADGKTIVDKLLRKKPKPRTTQIPTESSRDIKLKNMRRMIKKNEDIIADAEKKIDLLNIGTSSRTDRSLQYHRNKIAEARDRIVALQNRIARLEKQATNVIPVERLSYHDRLTDMAEALRDRENGIYVPRPLLGMHGLSAMLSSLENQLWVKKVIQRRTELELRNLPEGSTLSLDMTPEPEQNEPEAVTQVPQVKTTKPKVTQNRRRRRNVDEETKVSQQIFELLDNFTRKQSAGRPRKYGQRPPNDPDEKQKLLMEHNVFRIFVDALNLDVEGTKLQSKKRLMDIRNSAVDLREKALRADLDLFQKALNCNLDSGENRDPSHSSKNATITDLTLQMLPRRAIEGPNAVRAYNLPPLPPTVSTLMGFKSLLLKRRQLIEISKKKVMIVQQKQPGKSKDTAARGKKRKQPADKEQSSSVDVASDSMQDCESDDGVSGQHLTSTLPVQQQDGSSGIGHNCSQDVQILSPASAPTSESQPSSDSLSFSTSSQSLSSPSQLLMEHHGQARIMILKGCDLNPETLSQVLKSRGIIANPDKVKLQMCKRSELASHILENSGHMNRSMGRRVQSKRTRQKAMKIIRQTHDFQLLKARFKSLFLWPALLSTIMVTSKADAEKEQTQDNTCRRERQKSQQQSETELRQQQQQQQRQGVLQYPGYLEEQHKEQELLMDTAILEAQQQQTQQQLEQQTELMLQDDDDDDVDDGLDGVLNDAGDDSIVIPPELLQAKPENREQSLKKTKKHKTKRTRYPCSHGKRFRKRVLQPRWVKEQQVEKLRQTKQKCLAEKAKQKQQQQEQQQQLGLNPANVDQLCEDIQDEAASESNNASSATSDVGQVASVIQMQLSATSVDGCSMEIECDQSQGQ